MAVSMRAMVMLLVLVGLPAAWVYYGPLPPQAQSVADRAIELAQDALGWERSPSTEATISAPRYNTDVAAEPLFEPTNSMAAARENPNSSVASRLAEQVEPLLGRQQVEPLLGRLRELGVSQYSLEKWGNAGQMYRFCCAMPLAQSDEATRQFEAVSKNPQASIEQVVAEVALWQTARLE